MTTGLEPQTPESLARLRSEIARANRSDWALVAAAAMANVADTFGGFPDMALPDKGSNPYSAFLLYSPIILLAILLVASLVNTLRNRRLASLPNLPALDSPYPRTVSVRPFVIPMVTKTVLALGVIALASSAIEFYADGTWPTKVALTGVVVALAVYSMYQGKPR